MMNVVPDAEYAEKCQLMHGIALGVGYTLCYVMMTELLWSVEAKIYCLSLRAGKGFYLGDGMRRI